MKVARNSTIAEHKASMLTAGTRIGPYAIVAKLGEGVMGVVYRAADTKLGRDVALTILPATVTADPERLARFDREARALASLNHPHIAQIYGIEAVPAGASGPQTALVMELAGRRPFDGGSVSDVLAAVMRDAPAFDALPPDIPISIRRLLRRCLEKDVSRFGRTGGPTAYDVSPDGSRFLMTERLEPPKQPVTRLRMVLN